LMDYACHVRKLKKELQKVMRTFHHNSDSLPHEVHMM
jgi:hypothetical protein